MSWKGVKEVYDNLNPKKWYNFLVNKYDIEKTGPYHMVYYAVPTTDKDINMNGKVNYTPYKMKSALMDLSDEDGCLLCIKKLLKEYGDNIKF